MCLNGLRCSQNAGKWQFESTKFQIFLGEHAPNPPSLVDANHSYKIPDPPLLITVKGSCRLSTIFRDAGMKQITSASTPTRVTRCSALLLDHLYVTHPEQIMESLVPIYGLSDHDPVCFVHRSRGPKSPKSHHDTIKYGASRILTRIVLFTIYTLLHGRFLTCLKM